MVDTKQYKPSKSSVSCFFTSISVYTFIFNSGGKKSSIKSFLIIYFIYITLDNNIVSGTSKNLPIFGNNDTEGKGK